MNENLQIIFGLLGGLAVFLFGMNMMSECLQKAAGEKMKSIFIPTDEKSRNGSDRRRSYHCCSAEQQRYYCYGDRLCQRGLMTLRQAISIILGANIGTTVTAQIIAF